MSIGQIAAAIYNIVENLPATNMYYQAMNSLLSGYDYITMFNWTDSSITNSGTSPDTYALASSDTGYIFPSGTQPDTLVISSGYQESSLGMAGNGGYFTFQGDASGYNAIDINYNPQYISDLKYYLADAANFQILDFNYSQGDYSGFYSSALDLSTINSGFNTFILDDTYNNSGSSYPLFMFTNATGSDMFAVQATTEMLLVENSSTSSDTTNIIMDGGTNGVGLGLLVFSPYYSGNSDSVINIDSIGTAANTIQLMGDLNITGDNLAGSFTINVYGSDPLSIGSQYSLPYSAVSTNENGIELHDGSTLSLNGNSGSSLTAYIYENSATQSSGVTVNASGFAGTLNLIESQFSSTSPDTFILGTGTDSVATNDGNATVTVGSGADTIIINSTYSTDSVYYLGQTVTPGHITVIQGNIGSNDSIIFGTPLGSTPADWSVYPGQTGSSGEGISVSSLVQYNVTGAASATAAIASVIATLEGEWAALNNSGSTQDFAGWFQYNGNTYIVNSVALQNQVVELVGTYTISPASVGHLAV